MGEPGDAVSTGELCLVPVEHLLHADCHTTSWSLGIEDTVSNLQSFTRTHAHICTHPPPQMHTSIQFICLELNYLSQCYKPEEFNGQCPVCSKPFNKLSNPLPFSHCAQSYLICSLSGQPMNEHNPPMALPNGYIYGEQVSQLPPTILCRIKYKTPTNCCLPSMSAHTPTHVRAHTHTRRL